MGRQVLIIGGGVIGLASAYYCARNGHSVAILDRNQPEHGGCTSGNAGMIVPSHFTPLAAPGAVALGLKWMFNPQSPFWIKPRPDPDLAVWGWNFWRSSNRARVEKAAPLLRDLHLASRAQFEQLAALPGVDFGLEKKGLLMLCQENHTWLEEGKMAEQARKLGVPAEVLDAKQTAALDPGVEMAISGAVFYPKDCHLNPAAFLSALRQENAKLGVAVHSECEVIKWKTSGGKIESVSTPKREFAADEFVLAGGAWSAQVARGLGLKIPLQAGKGYSLTLNNPRQLPQICSILTEARVAVTPIGSTLRFGGTMEMAGLDETINLGRVQGITQAAVRYFPRFKSADFEGVKPWSGLRPCSPDGLPYLGRTRRFRNLSLNTGHAMMGLSLAPVSGRLLAEVVDESKPSFPLELLNPDRFG